MSHELTIKQKLSAWLSQQNNDYTNKSIPFDYPIIEQRVITSVQIMELILYLEQLRGQPINPTHIQAGTFSTINSIYHHFFVDEPEHV